MSRTSILKSFLFGFCACVNFAIPMTLLVSMNILFTDWLTYFQADKGPTSAVQATCFGITFAGGLVAGVLERKLGERRCLMLGSFLSTVGLFSGSYAPSLPVLILCIGVITGSGFCIVILTSLSIALRRFPKRAGFVSSATAVTSGLFHFSTPILFRFFSDEYMWQGCLMFASVIALYTFVFGLLLTSPVFQSTQELSTDPPSPDQGQTHEAPMRNDLTNDSEPEDLEATAKETYTEHHSWLRDSRSRSSPDSMSEHPILQSSQSENQRDVFPTHQNGQQMSLSFLKNPLYICIVLYSVMSISTVTPFMRLVLDYTSGRGWSVQDGLQINFLFLLSTLLTRALTGVVSLNARVHNTALLIIGGLIGCTGVCFIGQVDSLTLAAVFYVCMGVGFGVTVGIYPAAVMDTIGTRDFSIGIGLAFTVEGITSAVVGILTGVLLDILQSYSLISLVYGVVILAFTILLLVVFLRCRR